MMIPRPRHVQRLLELVGRHPVTAILGARQVGKTTLARQVADARGGPSHRFDLDEPAGLARLADPDLALSPLRGLVVIDEVQRRPDLFRALRPLADRPEQPVRFLILGSASPDLLHQSAESLAGRIAYYELPGFSIPEVGAAALVPLWVRGGFPRSFLAESDSISYEWRLGFLRTFLERDLAELGIRIRSDTLRRFWTMIAHYHGQIWSGAELARAFGIAGTTVRHYLDTLSAALVLRQLQPWHVNVAKRQVKSPKVFVHDSGLMHALLGLESNDDLQGHPKVGASWEGFAGGEVITHLGARREECFFWATHSGAELDLLVVRGRRRRGFEFKYTSAPTVTRSMRVAMHDLGLTRLDVVHAGSAAFEMAQGIHAVPLAELGTHIEPL
jgi:predicted AAA+ superfamily ATPase